MYIWRAQKIFSHNSPLMNKQPSVGIVILNWNTSHFLKRFLPSILATTYLNKEIYVVDNSSSDDSVFMLKEHFPEVNIICLRANEGYARGYNIALSEIKTDYFILVNSDIEVTPGFIEPVISFMETDVKIGICQPKLLALDNKKMFEYAGAAGGWIDKLGFPFARGRVFTSIESDNGQYDKTERIFWATGACMFLKKEVFQATGGFYDYYYMHQEDIDLCWRARNIGYEIYTCPNSIVYHIGGGTLSWENYLKTLLTFRNNYILLARNLKLSIAIPIVILRMMLDFGGSIYFLFKNKPGISWAIIKAEFAFLYWLFFYPNKKNKQPKGFKGDIGIYRGTILVPYFIQNKKKFSELVHNNS